jgi:adenosine/AMP kinase
VDLNDEIKGTVDELVAKLNNQVGSSSDLAKTVTQLLNDLASLNSINDQINDAITDAKNDIKTQLQNLVTKAYNKLNSFFSKTPNKALQPVLVAKDGKKISLLSKSKKNPTKVSGSSLTLIPTSYTLELVAPAYKKFIAVTDVWDASGNPAAASIGKAANGENMLKVIDSEKTCTMNGQAGYTYEVAYSAVDYHGKVVIKRFYVKF